MTVVSRIPERDRDAENAKALDSVRARLADWSPRKAHGKITLVVRGGTVERLIVEESTKTQDL